jgi:hypothetical protein
LNVLLFTFLLQITIFSLVVTTGLSAPLNLVYPHVFPFPSAYAAPVHVVHAVPAVETRLHYAETPVVVGHTSQILKPNLTPFVIAPLATPTVAVVPSADSSPAVVEAKKEDAAPMETVETIVEDKKVEEVPTEKAAEEVKTSSVPLTYVSHHPFAYAAPSPLTFAAPHIAYAAAPAVLDLKASVPTGDAPSMDVLVTKQKVLAPVRAISEVTPQVTVQHPTKVNIDKVAVEVPVATPYALPVPVPVAPHYEIHHVHTPTLTLVA